jgi:hypothetical protein
MKSSKLCASAGDSQVLPPFKLRSSSLTGKGRERLGQVREDRARKRSATGAQLAHALSASHCPLTDWRPSLISSRGLLSQLVVGGRDGSGQPRLAAHRPLQSANHPMRDVVVSRNRSASRPQQGAGELPGLMKRDRASVASICADHDKL